MPKIVPVFLLSVAALSGCQPTTGTATAGAGADLCGAARYQSLVGRPLPAQALLDFPDDSRYYGASERVATDNPRRLNLQVSTPGIVEAFGNPNAVVTRVFCG